MLHRKAVEPGDWDFIAEPVELAQVDYQWRLSQEEFNILKMGCLPHDYAVDTLAFFDDGWLDDYHYRHSTREAMLKYKVKIVPEGNGYRITEAWGRVMAHKNYEPELDKLLWEIKLTLHPAKRTDWENLQPMPEQKVPVPLDLTLTEQEFLKMAWGLRPCEQDDKWFIFVENNTLYCYRSWTGLCVYQVRFEQVEGGYRAAEAWGNRSLEIQSPLDANTLLEMIHWRTAFAYTILP